MPDFCVILDTHTHTLPQGAAKLRPLDFGERRGFVKGTVREIVHDSGRGAPVALVQFRHPYKYKRLTFRMLAIEGMQTGQFLYCGKRAELAIGNCLPLKMVPEGSIISSIELKTGDRGALV